VTTGPGHPAVAAAGQSRPGFEVPVGLARNIAEDDEDGPARRAWLEALPGTVAGLAERWSLAVGRPFQPGGNASWAAPARDAAGRRLVLKAGWRHAEAEDEAAGLRAWDGRGAVRVYRWLLAGDTSALLLEACEPGTPLEEALPPREQDVVVAGLLRRLWTGPLAGHPFPSLEVMCERWAGEFERRYAAARARGSPELDPGIARAGIELFRLLPATAGRRVLLCTDLHPGNVLAAEGTGVVTGATVTGVRAEGRSRSVLLKTAAGGERELACDQILVAAGRRPVTAGLNLAAAGVRAGRRGEVATDTRQRTGNPRIWAAGDATGGPPYVYTAAAQGSAAAANALFHAEREVDYARLVNVRL
jgi:streptomycin 6-kinase